MNTHIHESVKDEKGFTLVELAIVMVIIGLLIGGILKGQEMIANAQVSATVAQLKGVDAATSTFRDMYDALPGDITNPAVRIPGCGVAPCNIAGNGNSSLDGVGVAGVQAASEETRFWIHLNAADLLTGVDGSANLVWGQGLPTAKAGGGLTAGFDADGNIGALGNGRGGHYVAIQGDPATATSAALTASEAARMDRKMDDGSANSGSFLAGGGANCGTAAVYNEAADQVACWVAVRIQG